MGQKRVTWYRCEPPLPPASLAVRGDGFARLLRKLGRLDPHAVGRLRAVSCTLACHAKALVVVGDGEDLPWVDGAVYLGRDPEARQLLLPTTSRPDVPLDLFEGALRRRLGDVRGELAVLPEWSSVITLASARRLDGPTLEYLGRLAP